MTTLKPYSGPDHRTFVLRLGLRKSSCTFRDRPKRKHPCPTHPPKQGTGTSLKQWRNHRDTYKNSFTLCSFRTTIPSDFNRQTKRPPVPFDCLFHIINRRRRIVHGCLNPRTLLCPGTGVAQTPSPWARVQVLERHRRPTLGPVSRYWRDTDTLPLDPCRRRCHN